MTAAPASPAVFVDRDNTLIDDPGYISHPDQVHLLPGAAQCVARLRQAGYPVVVVTNQSGVARGLFTEQQLADVHQRMQDLLQEHGTGVDAVYYCPFLDGPDAVCESYRRDSDLRKPKPGMLLLAAREMGLDLARSWLIGDSPRDIQAGKAAGCRTVLLDPRGQAAASSADHVVPDLTAAVDFILSQLEAVQSQGPRATLPDYCGNTGGQPEAPARATRERGSADLPIAPQLEAVAMEPTTQLDAHHAPNDSAHAPAADRPADASRPTTKPGKYPTTAAVLATTTAVHDRNDAADQRNDTGAPGECHPPDTAAVFQQILDELRAARREHRHDDFSIGKLAGAVAQALALCALGWGLYAWSNASTEGPAATTATIALLAAIVFQLMALTFFHAGRK